MGSEIKKIRFSALFSVILGLCSFTFTLYGQVENLAGKLNLVKMYSMAIFELGF